MKVAILGSRNFISYEQFIMKLEYNYPEVFTDEVTELVSGGGEGVDNLVEQLARVTGKPIKIIFPDYIKYGREAPRYKDQEIANYADRCILLLDKYIDHNFHHIYDLFRKLEKPVDESDLTDESFCLDWYKYEGYELPEINEDNRRGDIDSSFPHPPLRYRLLVSVGAWNKSKSEMIEGGYYVYREDAEKVGQIIKEQYSYFVSPINVMIGEL